MGKMFAFLTQSCKSYILYQYLEIMFTNHDYIFMKYLLQKGRINIALDNVITFAIKVSRKYLLVSESYI